MATLTSTSHPREPQASSPAEWLRRFGVYVLLLAGLAFTVVPFIYVLFSSMKTSAEIIRIPPNFLPDRWTLDNYFKIINDPNVPLWHFYANSSVVAVARVLITLFTSSFAGYLFAKYRFWGRSAMFTFILAQIMIPFQVVMIPAYLILVKLNLVDSLLGLIIPSMIDAFGIFMMRQFIESIPNELMDAARIDGAGEFGIYRQIILPQLGPALASLGIFTFMATWNDYLWPLIVITTLEKRTLPLLLSWYSNAKANFPNLTMAASIMVLLPNLIVYAFFQRWIVRGVTLTGFK